MVNREKAKKLLDLALELEEEGKTDETIRVYLKTIESDPTWAVPYYNLGLIYKYRCDWYNSLTYNAKSIELDPFDKATIWNLGIAATALKDWKTARDAWKTFGIKLPNEKENTELRMDLGITPVRLKENKEVIWTDRIDPARAIIHNVPTPDSKRRFKDIVLNDGAPNGIRTHNGFEFPVFDELELFEKSPYLTFSAWVQVEDIKLLNSIEEILDKRGCGFENWTDSIRYICKQCSEGKPHEHHDKSLAKKVEKGEYHLGLAAKSEMDIMNILESWKRLTQSEVIDFQRVL